MKPYILQVAHLGKVSEGQYVAHIAILDSDKHCFTGIPYKIIIVDAINEEIARKIADIRIEEMMLNNASEIDSIYDKNILIDIKKNYSKMYAGLGVDMDQLRTKQENLLTEILRDVQQDAKKGIDIEEMDIYVDLDGNEGYLVYAIRVVKDGDSEYLELKIDGDCGDFEWLSIYDFYAGTAEKILSEIMENL